MVAEDNHLYFAYKSPLGCFTQLDVRYGCFLVSMFRSMFSINSMFQSMLSIIHVSEYVLYHPCFKVCSLLSMFQSMFLNVTEISLDLRFVEDRALHLF